MKTPTIDSLYLRYFLDVDGEQTNETFVSLSDIDYVGTPMDAETGEDLECDRMIYASAPDHDGFVQVVGIELRKDN
jgi:hypothetical protein